MITVEPTDELAELTDGEAGEPPVPADSGAARRRLLGRVAAVAASALFVYLAFTTVGAEVMQSERQGHLASDFTQSRAKIEDGQALAVLQVPSIGVNEVVAEGASVDNLRGGPVHDASTPLPGKAGNAVIVGHRNGYGGPFRSLAKLHPGDQVIVKTRGGAALGFVVVGTAKASGSSPLLAPTKDARITLVTADGGRLSSDEFIVQAAAPGTPPLAAEPTPASAIQPAASSGPAITTTVPAVVASSTTVAPVAGGGGGARPLPRVAPTSTVLSSTSGAAVTASSKATAGSASAQSTVAAPPSAPATTLTPSSASGAQTEPRAVGTVSIQRANVLLLILLADLALAAAYACYRGLRGRHSGLVVGAVTAPIVVFAVFQFLLSLDSLLPPLK